MVIDYGSMGRQFKEFKRKPSFSRAFRFTGLSSIPYDGPQIREESEGGFAVFNELHQSWIKFKSGDYIVGVPGDYYPHEESLFEKSHEGFE